MKYRVLLLLFSLFSFSSFAQEYDDFIGAGHAIGVSVSSSDDQSNGLKSVDGDGLDLDIQGSSRFLAHATLGFSIEEVEELADIGVNAWLDEQFQKESISLTESTIEIALFIRDECIDQFGETACEELFNINAAYFRYAWWNNFRYGEDLLRQRVALALSEILILSDQSQLVNSPHGIAAYYDILTRNAFGNYKDILTEVTYNPSMGFYLSHINNPRTIEEENVLPDENYAREIMQLFSIGLFELNQDGTRKIDPQTGLFIPTYDNDDITGLAKVFTGLSGSAYANENNTNPVVFGLPYQAYNPTVPMQMYPLWHEPGEKTIVGDFTIPAGFSGDEDIEMAIDHLFNHENVGPFLSNLLIQRLVKSNPTPNYIERVATVFNDNGSGIRGDMEATIRAILTDQEALECFWFGIPSNGALRPPTQRLTQMVKGLKAEAPNGKYWTTGIQFQRFTSQHPMSSPTVFNFYSPDYIPDSDFANEGLVGPEYQILNSSTSSNYVNFLLVVLLRDHANENEPLIPQVEDLLNESSIIPFVTDNEQYEADFTDRLLYDLISDPDQLVDYLDILMANGNLNPDTKELLANSIADNTIFDDVAKSLYSIFLVMINPEYIIMK